MPLALRRLLSDPIIHPGLHPSLGDNINGPSLIETPPWLPRRQARFYLFFAHHTGDHIRLALADQLTGPWRVHPFGALHLNQTPFAQDAPQLAQPDWARAQGVDGLVPHIASPDVHIDTPRKRLIMWLHGLDRDGEQRSVRAESSDGFTWNLDPRRIEQSYLRVFRYEGTRYAMAHGGQFMRETASGDFEPGPCPFPTGHRHAGLLVRDHLLHVLWTRIGDRPERIWHSVVPLEGDWRAWRVDTTREVMRPTQPWEGCHEPLEPSQIGAARGREHALRDPAFVETSRGVYVIHAGGGESGLGLAEVLGI